MGGVLLLLARDPGMRLRDIAARLGITERSAYGIIADLTGAGDISKRKDGRRNRYQIEAHQPLPEPASRERTVGDVLALLTGTSTDTERTKHRHGHRHGHRPGRWPGPTTGGRGARLSPPGRGAWCPGHGSYQAACSASI